MKEKGGEERKVESADAEESGAEGPARRRQASRAGNEPEGGREGQEGRDVEAQAKWHEGRRRDAHGRMNGGKETSAQRKRAQRGMEGAPEGGRGGMGARGSAQGSRGQKVAQERGEQGKKRRGGGTSQRTRGPAAKEGGAEGSEDHASQDWAAWREAAEGRKTRPCSAGQPVERDRRGSRG